MAGTRFKKRIYLHLMHRFISKGILRGHPLWLVFGVSASFFKLKSLIEGGNGREKIFSYELELGRAARFMQRPRREAK